jgi:hypothetical protein
MLVLLSSYRIAPGFVWSEERGQKFGMRPGTRGGAIAAGWFAGNTALRAAIAELAPGKE